MLKKTLIAMMCSMSLVACGGGGGGGSFSSGGADGGQVTTPVSDLEKAKQLIKTTNAIVSYYDGFQDIADKYKVPAETVNNTASDLGNATRFVVFLADLAYDDANGQTKTYDAQALQQLYDNYTKVARYSPDYDFKNSNLVVNVTSDSIAVSGAVEVAYWEAYKSEINHTDPDWYLKKENFIFSAPTKVIVQNVVLDAPFLANQKDFSFKLRKGGSIETLNAKNQKAKFAFNADSTASLKFTEAKPLEDQNGMPESANLSLLNIIFESEGVSATLTEFTAKVQKAKFNTNGMIEAELIPSEVTLKGVVKYLDESLNLEAKLNLNNDFSQVIQSEETATSFLNANLNVKLSGNLKGANATPTPFSIDINAKRAEFTKGIATVTVAVDKNALDIELTAKDVDQENTILSGVIKHKNGASLEITDIDKFTSSDIKVAGQTYGAVTKNSSGLYVAKFTDNEVILIAP